MLGDQALSEGSMWEAMAFSGIYKQNNLVAVLDINNLGQCDPAPIQDQLHIYQKPCEVLAGTLSLWMDRTWRSCIRPFVRPSTN